MRRERTRDELRLPAFLSSSASKDIIYQIVHTRIDGCPCLPTGEEPKGRSRVELERGAVREVFALTVAKRERDGGVVDLVPPEGIWAVPDCLL